MTYELSRELLGNPVYAAANIFSSEPQLEAFGYMLMVKMNLMNLFQ